MEVIFKFKKEIFGLILVGIIMLAVAFVLAPDKGEQIINTLVIFAAIFIMIPLLLITFRYFIDERAH